MKYLYNDSSKYGDVKVSETNYTEKDGRTLAKVMLCLVVKTSDGTFIEDVFIAKVKTGYLDDGFPVKRDSAEFQPLGKLQSFNQSSHKSISQSINQSNNQSVEQLIDCSFIVGAKAPIYLVYVHIH